MQGRSQDSSFTSHNIAGSGQKKSVDSINKKTGAYATVRLFESFVGYA
jgi:hypothetical protein